MGSDNKPVIERLFLDHADGLLAFFRRRVRQMPDAPDLAQEVYLRMLRLKDIESIRNLEPYIFTIASNLLKEHAVKSRYHSSWDPIDDEDIQEQIASLPHMDGDIDTDERVKHMNRALAELSPSCRAVVQLRYRDELGYGEIAGRLNISISMVKKHLSNAIVHCRRRMERLR